MKKLVEEFSNAIYQINIFDDLTNAKFYEIADGILEKEATSLFLSKFPGAKNIVLLDRTIEGEVRTKWEILNLSPEFLAQIQEYRAEIEKEMDIQRCAKLGYCIVCERKFIMLPEVSDKEAQGVARRLVKQHKLVATRCFCPYCCDNLKTDSDFEGLTYI